METGNAEAMNCRVKDESDDVMRRQQYWIYPRDMEVLYSKMRLVGLDGVVHTMHMPWCRHQQGINLFLNQLAHPS